MTEPRTEPDMRDLSRCWQNSGWHAHMAGPCFDTIEQAREYRDALDARGLKQDEAREARPPTPPKPGPDREYA